MKPRLLWALGVLEKGLLPHAQYVWQMVDCRRLMPPDDVACRLRLTKRELLQQ